jgi:hypothetical protein
MGIMSIKLNTYYFGEMSVTASDIRQTFVSLFLVWIIITVFQLISLQYYLPRLSWHISAWFLLITVGFSAWWTGIILAPNESIFRLVFIGGWVILGFIQILLLRILFPNHKSKWFLYWLFAVLSVLVMYGVQTTLGKTGFFEIMVPGISLPGVIYGVTTGFILDRMYKQENPASPLAPQDAPA